MLVACAVTNIGAGIAGSAYLTLGLAQVRRVVRQITPADGLAR
jgi:hypothetical protein